jgi:pyroglutamyl-peptidase
MSTARAAATAYDIRVPTSPVVLVTGFQPFGPHPANPSEELAKAVDGRTFGSCVVRTAILPVHHREAGAVVDRALAEVDPIAVVHLGLAAGRARVALERVAVNVMDYALPDNAGYEARDEACVPGGPAGYFSTFPLRAMLVALLADGIPSYISDTAGTYLCNQTLYRTLHAVTAGHHRATAGFVHFPLTPAMVAASGLDQPSMDVGLMLRAVETVLGVLARSRA